MVCQGGRRRIGAKGPGVVKDSPAKSTASGPAPTPSPNKVMTKTQQRKFSKQEDKFVTSVGFIFDADSREDATYCKSQIDKHPEWVPYLSSLFRRGTFEKMMQKDTEKQQLQELEAKYGRAIHSRIRKVDKLPTSVKLSFLTAVNKTINGTEWEDALINKAFAFALHIEPSTPLPDGDEYRFEKVMEKVCMIRYMSLKCPLAQNMSETPGPDDFNFFSLTGSSVSFKPQRTTAKLPGGDSMQWVLKDPDSMLCTAVAAAFKGCSQNVASLFDGVEENWGAAWAGPGVDKLDEELKNFVPFSASE